jgi:argininosuccinate synthase
MKSRGMYETPGGTIYHAAHRAIEQLTPIAARPTSRTS